MIMKDIMNMATILIRNPKSIEDLCLGLFEEKNTSNDDITSPKPNLESLKEKLDEVDKPNDPLAPPGGELGRPPLHPVDVFDMIVGTSTGKCLLI